MKYKAIIFDMDGTIIDTEHVWKQATYDLITSKGVELTPELSKELDVLIRGIAVHRSCAIIKDFLKIDHAVEDMIKEKIDRAQALLKDGMKFIDGFERFHDKVIKAQLPTGIATNADDQTLNKSTETMGLTKYFGEHIYNITHVNNKAKPDPDLYLHVAQRLGVKPEECIAIEDSAHGIRAAKRAGMFCIGINTAKNHEALKEADIIIEHYDDIELDKLLNIDK